MSKHILVIEDESDIARTLEFNLRERGYEPQVAGTAGAAWEQATRDPRPDLILLDLMLPDTSGIELARRLRAHERTRHTPIIMLTAKGDEIDRVVGFEVGADDYVTKPFSIRELILRIEATLRRAEHADQRAAEAVVFGHLRLDPDAHRVWVEGEEIPLTATEFRLLTTLMSRRGRVQTREHLLTTVWGLRGDTATRTVDTHVKRLRAKLGRAGDYITTLRGVGYRFEEDPHKTAS